MTEDEFIQRWHAERPAYEQWGQYVADRLIKALEAIVAPVTTDVFVRIPILPRVKTTGSFLTKAFYNPNKTYDDPFQQITDKVGVRLVVLLASQISKVTSAIEQCDAWNYSKDRDYESEVAARPSAFEYQSVHYVVRNKTPMRIANIDIPESLPCEIQIRTLMQHAHSELTHDTIYKPSVEKTPEMERAVSKAMALIEATNDYFEQVAARIEVAVSDTRKLTDQLAYLYEQRTGIRAEMTRVDSLLMEAFSPNSDGVLEKVTAFLNQKSFVSEKIANRAKIKILFRQPSILIAYLAVSERPSDALNRWPLTRSELAPIYADLGLAMNG
ncbi:GTP pyrophosphokinase [Tardiphaga sp. 20_F10_N6_6]|uniref:GTP pyrophosphokinase n=1 Tax=Tardiphaga sp. 20_F10_N6_6 TaxID=3240788 RepID=UPI003F8C7E07